MIFSSITFLYFFLPAVLLVYAIVPGKFKNLVLFLSSLIFYAWGERHLVILFALSIFAGWIFALGIEKKKGSAISKILLVTAILFDLSILIYFKYSDFFIQSINSAFGASIPLLKIALPIGISFYTFQLLSYEIDVWRGTVHAQKNFIDFGTYVAMFPQLIAGPIVRYADIESQLKNRNHSIQKISQGITRFVTGFGKKVLIANCLGELISAFQNSTQPSVLFYWLYAIAFMLQIYFDFSGYSDMAIGLGKFFGFELNENFDYPYVSKTVTEFWRRWHISLGTWFKDYVYIPLGGNRKGILKQIFNIFIVWMLTGMWHGAAWNFVLWGIFYAILLILEKVFLKKWLDNHHFISHFYLLFVVLAGFILFDAKDLSECILHLKGLFAFSSLPACNTETLYYLKSYSITLIIAAAGSTPLIKNLCSKIAESHYSKIWDYLQIIILLFILVAGTAFLVDGSFNPFLYFRF